MPTNANDLIETLSSISKCSFESDDDRVRAVAAARSLYIRLESPYERFLRYGWTDPSLDAALATCRDLDLFNKWPEDRSKSMSVVELAQSSGAGEDALRRVCKHLAATEDLIEVAEDDYRLTDFTFSLRDPTRNSLIGHDFQKAVRSIPQWLAQNGYKTPSDFKNCPFQLGVAPEHTWWSWTAANAKLGERFNKTMQGMASEWKNAIGAYPVQEKLIDGFKGGVLMVDLGGGVGHDLEAFYENFSVEGAEYILQDVPTVVDAANPQSPIKKMEHDFFTEQPVQGPRSFFLKQIMHDWPDEQAIDIIAKLRPAMTPRYTKLLIHDLVVPPTGAPPYATGIDLTMMALFGARERSQAMWDALIKAANLKLEKVWSGPAYRESVLEVVREE